VDVNLEGNGIRSSAVTPVSAEALAADVTGLRAGPPGDQAGEQPGRRRWWLPLVWLGAAVALFFVYLRVSQTEPGDSYGAVFTLQAWDMLHGNLLLHGWSLSDVSFYTTELPEYLVVDLIRGLNPDVVHIAASVTFTLLMLLTALLANGRAAGKRGVVGVLMAAGIMCSPQLGNGIFVLLLAPDHLGTCVPVLLAWLVLDRAPARWYVPVVIGVLLAWVLIADSVVLITAVAPLVIVSAIRVYQGVVRQRLPWRSRWYEVCLLAAGLAAAGISAGVLALIRSHGGFYVNPVTPHIAGLTALPHHLLLGLEGLLLLFGGDFLGQSLGLTAGFLLLHLVGLALALWAVCSAVRRFRGLDLVSQLLAVAIFINLAAFVLWAKVGDITTTREMAAVLPFSAALAGRLLAGRLTAARLVPALSVVFAGYLTSLGILAAHPVQQPQFQQLTSWLTRHGFHYGLGSTVGSVVTVSSGQRVWVVQLSVKHHELVPTQWEVKASWFDPRLHNANFVVLAGTRPEWTIRSTFGSPEQTYHFGPYMVMTWDQNLLIKLQ
jgi:hypothetical protein